MRIFDWLRGLQGMYVSQKTFVFNDEGKFLTLLRTKTAPKRPLKWDLPGGAHEAGEDPMEGAKREILEETGLTVADLKPLTLAGEYVGNRWGVTVAYTAKALTTDVRLSYEHDEYRWVNKEEFLELDSSEKWKGIAQAYLV